MKVGIIHATLNAIEPISDAFRRVDPDIDVRNFLNEELLAHANAVGGVDNWGKRNFFRTAMMAAEASLDGIMIACTLYTEYAQEISHFTDVPVIAVDDPMITKAVKDGSVIGILATTAASGPSARDKLLREAKLQNKSITTHMSIVTEAMSALRIGNEEKHNELLLEAAIKLHSMGCDTLLLSQITMACAAPIIRAQGYTVLTSPDTGAEELVSMMKRR